MAQFTDFALDLFATNLSTFTSPQIPELQRKPTLHFNFWESALGTLSGRGNARARSLVTNLVRRTFAAAEFYRVGRERALEYVAGDRHWSLQPYFEALAQFEACVSSNWQVCDLVNKMVTHHGAESRVFQSGDGTAWERLHGVYTVGVKHSFRSSSATTANLPTTVWLTNEGIEALGSWSITYAELAEMIDANDVFFTDITKRIREKVTARRRTSRDPDARP